ncbi:MAG TPA: T9SS type A sorting domain-containing protein [Chitinophagales bacterium]|nr:T9SS type A sorting domain-containing protein [Chitinophagales bacterium]
MLNFTKKILATFILVTSVCFAVAGQTNVSGGIYTNTTWTSVNSPYIIVDTVVVFPGVTLTIQPGVVVKFANNKRLEIREAKLAALGTVADSITFTSNSLSPIQGIWSSIYLNAGAGTDTLKFNYCNFKYADVALNGNNYNSNYSLVIKNSVFSYNNTAITSNWCNDALIDSCTFNNNLDYGIRGLTNFHVNFCKFINNGIGLSKYVFLTTYAYITSCDFYYNETGISDLCTCVVENCTVKHNQYGISDGPYGGSYSVVKNCIIDSNYIAGLTINDGDSIINNKIRYNPIGLTDSMDVFFFDNIISKNIIENNDVGIKLFFSFNQVYCNKISNNTTYDLYYSVVFGSNLNAGNNYWSTFDSMATTAKIYDGYDNISLGLVNFMPLDSEQCYLQNGIATNTISAVPVISLSIFPNPVSNNLTVTLPANILGTEIKIFNTLGELEYSSSAMAQTIDIDVSTLSRGVHIFQITAGNNISREKFIKQ